jgi:CHAT domain-containing protein
VLQLTPQDYERGRRGERIGAGKRSPLLLSGLVLAGANRKDKDKPETWVQDGGIVTGEDLVGLDLRGLRLAVLSACETGLGDVAGGEGVYGLARALHVAGCRDVVASLWQVDDQATAALMTLFYAHLWQQGQPPLEALRQAQLQLYRHPEQVAALARERGPRPGTVVPVEGAAAARPVADQAAGTAHPKLWAAFVLSGPGR